MLLSDQRVHALLVACSETHADEIDCEQFLAVMPEYAEACAERVALPARLVKAAQHERLCANCREECRALVELVGSSVR